MAVSHANCTHARTPAGRRACRAGNAAPVVTPLTGTAFDPAVMPEIKMTAATARKLARHAAAADRLRASREDSARKPVQKPARIQPRRSGARVSRDGSSCVQAALHTSNGRCACGWHTPGFCYSSDTCGH